MSENNLLEDDDWCWSADGERFYTEKDDAIGDLCLKDGVIKCTLTVGYKVMQTHYNFLDVPEIIQRMQESAYEQFPEYSDDYLEDLSQDDAMELEQLILDFLNERASQPKFYSVTNTKEILVSVPKED